MQYSKPSEWVSNKMKSYTTSRKISLSLVIALIFILSFFSLASGISVTQLQTGTLTQTKGTGGLVFDNLGTNLYAFGNQDDTNNNNTISQYSLSTAYQLNTLSFVAKYYPFTYAPNDYKNYTLTAGYITNDGKNMYILAKNTTSDFMDTNTHRATFVILHFSLNNWDLSTTQFIDNYTWVQAGTQYGIPSFWGIWVNSAGDEVVISGRVNVVQSPIIYHYNTTQAFNVTTLTYSYTPYINSYSSWGSFYNIWYSADKSFYTVLERDVHQGVYDTYIYYRQNSSSNFTRSQVLTVNREGQTMATDYTSNVYLFNQNGGTIYKYLVVNLTVNGTVAPEVEQGNVNVKKSVDSILGLFPDSSTLTSRQKIMYVLIFMIVLAVGLLFLAGQLADGIHSAMIYIVGILEVVAFIFFVAIGYINVGYLLLIGIVCVALAYLYVKFSHHGG